MAQALTPPFAIAAIVLCVAAVAKLRTPHTAARALTLLSGVTPRAAAGAGVVRCLAAAELALGLWCLSAPSAIGAALLAGTYAGFAMVALLLARRRASCGCFGEGREAPASPAQAALSGVLALVALVSAFASPHGLGGLVQEPAATAVVLALGIGAGAYGVVLAYTDLPLAWSAWAGRWG